MIQCLLCCRINKFVLLSVAGSHTRKLNKRRHQHTLHSVFGWCSQCCTSLQPLHQLCHWDNGLRGLPNLSYGQGESPGQDGVELLGGHTAWGPEPARQTSPHPVTPHCMWAGVHYWHMHGNVLMNLCEYMRGLFRKSESWTISLSGWKKC